MRTKLIVHLSLSEKDTKKYVVDVEGKRIHFGAAGYSDFTKHKDPTRKANYVRRHKARENWRKSGIKTAGFWSRWLLWNKPTLKESISSIEQRFNIIIRRRQQQ